MLRASFTAVLAALSLAAAPAAAAAQQYKSTFRGDGFDLSVQSNDGCSYSQLWMYGVDYSTKEGPGQPQQSNYLYGNFYSFDCDTQSTGYAWFDMANATMSATGTLGQTTVKGSAEVQFYHFEQGTEEVCYSWEETCYDANWNSCDCATSCEYVYEAGEYCEFPWIFVDDGTKTLGFNFAVAPTGDTYRGMNVGTSKGPNYFSRYRAVGSNRYGAPTGSLVLDGADLMSGAYAWSSVWTANSGSMSIYSF